MLIARGQISSLPTACAAFREHLAHTPWTGELAVAGY